MGIRGFRAWFESQFPSALTPIDKLPTGQDKNHYRCDRFDHVLIDMNQLLHVCVRKSRSDGHALTLMIMELDAIVRQIEPTQSIVLALDGPPSSAKLATQRRRRLSTVTKTEWKLQHLDRFSSQRRKGILTSKQLARKKRRAASETRTLCITPGTDFMHDAEQALLYWAWQRLDGRYNVLSQNRVSVYISPSTVAGEGEVKLLEWIYHKRRRGESIAILGGDSDLVLEGLVIPTASTHNVFVILPDGNQRYLSVSLWETSRTLAHALPQFRPSDLMKIRTDLVILLILNGNDYLPKLRGSSGFNKLFSTYLRLQRSWAKEGRPEPAGLVEPDTLEFHLAFGMAYFAGLAATAPDRFLTPEEQQASSEQGRMPLHQLNSFVDAGYIPSPVEFKVIRGSDELGEVVSALEDDEVVEEEDSDDGEEDEDEERLLVRLLIGKPGSDDFSAYETWHPRHLPLKDAKHALAKIALADLLDMDEDDMDEEDDEGEEGVPGLTSPRYEWEIKHAAESKVDSYLYGILWNLQTYQDGICADYAYNYGKRHSPTATDIVEFFQRALDSGEQVGIRQVREAPFSPPINAGLSCLAALPSKVKHLVPPPYRFLSDETVEEIYGSCMDPEDNRFDIDKFARLCEESVKDLDAAVADTAEDNQPHEGRRILLNDHSWTIVSKVSRPLSHPFDPPVPFSERLSKLRPNNRIRVSKLMSVQKPRPRSVWGDKVDSQQPKSDDDRKKSFAAKSMPREINHSEPAQFMLEAKSLDDVDYKTAYEAKKRPKPKKLKLTVKTAEGIELVATKNETIKVTNAPANGDEQESARGLVTADGLSAVACLKQLEDAGLVGLVQWETITPSPIASKDSDKFECVRLLVKQGEDEATSVLHEDLVFEQDRDLNVRSRKTLKQHLASLALCEITGPSIKWTDQSFLDLREKLQQRL